MWLIKLAVIIGLSMALVFISRVVVECFKQLVIKMGWGKIGVAAVLVALFTSLPEFVVGIVSALEGRPIISLGKVVGSNVANLSLIIGGAALLSGSVAVVGDFIRWEMAAALVAGVAPLILVTDGNLSRLDGVILLVIYAFYLKDLLGSGGRVRMKKNWKFDWVSRVKVWHHNHTDRLLVKMVGGVLVMVWLAEQIIATAVKLANEWQIPVLLVSLLVVAIGTSLPEFVLMVEAIKKKEVALVFGGLLGSVVTNATLILGVTAVIAPIKGVRWSSFGLLSLAFLLIFLFFWLFVSTKRRLDRWEGAVLLGIYLMFVGWQLMVS